MSNLRGVSLALVAASLLALPAFGGAVRGGFTGNTLGATDDGSTGSVGLGFSVNFFGAAGSSVFVNNNGNVTFTSALEQFTPQGLSTGTGIGQPIIAPFFADVDTNGAGSGLTQYGTGFAPVDAYLGWTGSMAAFGVEWPLVGYYDEQFDKLNTFELLLVDRSDVSAGDFDIEFNYDQIQWEAGDASGGANGLGGTSAVAGFSNGLEFPNTHFFQITGSLTNGALLDGGVNALISNSLGQSLNGHTPVLGRYDFQVRSGIVVNIPDQGTPEPGTVVTLLGGLAFAAYLRRRQA